MLSLNVTINCRNDPITYVATVTRFIQSTLMICLIFDIDTHTHTHTTILLLFHLLFLFLNDSRNRNSASILAHIDISLVWLQHSFLWQFRQVLLVVPNSVWWLWQILTGCMRYTLAFQWSHLLSICLILIQQLPPSQHLVVHLHWFLPNFNYFFTLKEKTNKWMRKGHNKLIWKLISCLKRTQFFLLQALGKPTSSSKALYAIGGDNGKWSSFRQTFFDIESVNLCQSFRMLLWIGTGITYTKEFAYDTVEVAPIDIFGTMGTWSLLPQRLPTPCTFGSAVTVSTLLLIKQNIFSF